MTNALKCFGLKAPRERKEKVGQAVPAGKPFVHQPPVRPIQETFFARPKGEIPANSLPSGNHFIQHHVGAQMAMLMSASVRRRAAVKADEFFDLRMVNNVKGLAESRVVKKLGVLAHDHEADDTRMIIGEPRRMHLSGKGLVEVQV